MLLLAFATVGLCVPLTQSMEKIEFHIDAGEARNTIREFGRQSEVSIIYKFQLITDIITHEVHGIYLPREALERMLDGTALGFDQDVASGAFALIRLDDLSSELSHGQSSANLADPTNDNPKQHPSKKMNTKKSNIGKLLTGLAGIFAAVITPQIVGQDLSPDEDIYELSPFVVDTTENVGYLATSTLAGTRIKTKLSDVGSAISVMTPEVFEDTGATDAESLLPYSLNVEVSGVQGNFADVSGAGGNRVRSNSTTRNSQGATRVRGLSSAVLARGLFRTDIPFDGYNTSAITINRGPNSLLFGATTPGGVIDQSLNQAEFGTDHGSFQVRVGERKSHREVLDFNKVLIDNRLALRFSMLNDEVQYQQRPTFKKDKRVYAAMRAVLFEGSEGGLIGRTTLRGNFENGDVDSNPPKIIPPGDGLTDWFEAPSRNLEQYTGTTFPDWVDNFVGKQTVDNRLGDRTKLNIPFMVQQPFFIDMPYIYHQPNLAAPSMGIAGLEHVAGIPARTLWRGVGGRGRVDLFGTSPFMGENLTPGFTVPVIMDRTILDNQNMSIMGTMPYRNYEFDVHNFAIEQELFDGKAGIEIAYDKQNYENEYHDPFSGGGGNTFRGFELRVDVMEYLPNLLPNPNLGRVYMSDFATPIEWHHTQRESKRMTAFYNLDFTENDGFTRWLGRNVFTAFYSHETTDNEHRTRQNKWIDAPGSNVEIATIVNDRLNGERRIAPVQVYLSDVLLGNEIQNASDIRLSNYITAPSPQPGDLVTVNYHGFFEGPENTTDPSAPLDEATFELYQSLIGGNATREINEGKAFSWQSFLFGGNLVGLIGWRDDRFKTVENISLSNFVNESSGANSDGLLDSGEFDGRRIQLADEGNPDHAAQVSSVSNETVTWSLVGHLPENLIELPLGARLSAHYNESKSFVPTRTRRDFNGDVIPPETGSTTEYGFTVELFEQRLSIRVNWFELLQNDANAGSGVYSPGVQPWLRFWKDAELQGIPFEDALMTGLHTRPNLSPNITSYEAMYAAIIDLLPQRQQDMFNIRFADDGRTVLSDPNPGQSVTTNAVAKGVEIDIVGNITDNWRMMFNWGQQETVTSDSAPVAGDFIYAVAENIANSGLGVVTQTPSLFEYSPMGQLWNGNINELISTRGKDGTASLEQRKHRVNLLSTYSFLTGSRLDGLTVGGALRWQSSIATGYETEVTSDGIVTPIISNPFMGPEELNGDVWISYKRKIEFFNTPLDWKIQLNVRNAIGSDDYIPVVTNPDGQVAVVRNPPTQEWFLTNTISF